MTAFNTDKQTIDDLQIFGKSGSQSIYQLFNRTHTQGGAALLEELFRQPLASAEAINERIAMIRFFQDQAISFPLEGNRFEEAERYLANTDPRSRLSNHGFSMADFKLTEQSVLALTEILYGLLDFLHAVGPRAAGTPYNREVQLMLELMGADVLKGVFAERGRGKLSSGKVVEWDGIYRFQHRTLLEKILRQVYQLDVYISIARVAMERSLHFPLALPSGEYRLYVRGVYHPLLPGAVPNNLLMNPDRHILFLTGANMAGKSTLMKSLGIAMYLAHLGFPVAAEEMEFGVCDGIYTTINLPDNLTMGASHFYSEVLRVKKIAGELASGRNLFVIFDELFRGTNVKDAYEATIDILEAFDLKRNSLFVVSTHIMEAGEVLRQRCPHMLFRYLPTRMERETPAYTYTLEEGITDDRHGMVIIRNEGVLELIEGVQGSAGQRQGAVRGAVVPGAAGRAAVPGATVSAGQERVDGLQADRQTTEDLQLLGKFKQQSIFSLFNQLVTGGGEKLLESMFRQPLTDVVLINRRSDQFAFFQRGDWAFPVTRLQMESMEDYLSGGSGASGLKVRINMIGKKIRQALWHDAELLHIQAGLSVTLEVLAAFRRFFDELAEKDKAGLFREEMGIAGALFRDVRLRRLLEKPDRELSFRQLMQADHTVRHALIREMEALLAILFRLDVFTGVAAIAARQGWVYAKAMPAETMVLRLDGVYHPALSGAVRNSLHLTQEQNVLFLTGANMAGKSTLMKSLGIAVYLAHMGFPVAAESMVFSVREGLFSSINVSDNLQMGYSHFYAEVLRTKAVAQSVHDGRDLFVIFDELFKGTNVKDAYDATLAVTKALAAHRNSFFIVSTHIIEVGEELGRDCRNIRFAYLPTVMEGMVPRYTYRLTEGITEDRQGMLIIRNEGIVEMIRRSEPKKQSVTTK